MFILKHCENRDLRLRTYNRIKRARKKKKVRQGPDPENNVIGILQ